MTESSIIVYVVAELAVVVMAVAVFLIFNIKKLKKVIRKLEIKISNMRKAIKKAQKETKKVKNELAEKNKIEPKDFVDFLDEEIQGTRDFHQTLNPDRDIVLDIAPDASLERQATSLRHALLIAEKEARYAGEEESSNWDVLQSKFQQIIQFYISAAPEPEPESESEVELESVDDSEPVDFSEEIESYKKRIANLEGFKKLFFEMEDKWSQVKKQADEYYQQLLAIGQNIGAGEEFNELLNKYSDSFDEIGNLIIEGGGGVASTAEPDILDTADNNTVSKMVFANQEEMQHLRNMAVDQYKIIEELKKKLVLTDSVELTDQAIADMTTQLEQQQRFIKEAETCTQLIEDELNRAFEENQSLRAQLDNGEGEQTKGSDDELVKLETMVKEFTEESRDMLSTIASLEEENSLLKTQLESTGSGSSDPGSNSADTQQLTDKLAEVQQELLNLQTQNIELEERYLELKMK